MKKLGLVLSYANHDSAFFFFFNYEEHANEKTKTQKKIDENNHVCGLGLLGSGGSFRELECGAYLYVILCSFFFFFFFLLKLKLSLYT